MPTKDELTAENAELKAKVAELEEAAESDEGGGLALEERVAAVAGAEAFDAAAVQAFDESGLDVDAWDALTDAEKTDAALHVLLRPTEAEGSKENDTVAMLRADLQRVTVERDEARTQLGLAQKRLKDAGTLHGSIDSLPPVA